MRATLRARPMMLAAGAMVVAAMAALGAGQVARAAQVPECLGKPATIVGTSGDDVLRGTRRQDVIVSLGGHDQIQLVGNSGFRFDLVCAGTGNDVLRGGTGRSRLFGDQGADTILGGPSIDRVHGGEGPGDILRGGPGVDEVYPGADGARVAHGGRGHDTLVGYEPDDTLRGGRGDDTLIGQEGDDRLLGNRGQDDLRGAQGFDTGNGGSNPDLGPDVCRSVERPTNCETLE